MSDTFNVKIGNDPENIYDAYPANREFKKRAEDENHPIVTNAKETGGFGWTDDASGIVHTIDPKYIGGGNEPDLEFQIEIPWGREDFSENSYPFTDDDLTVISGSFDTIREKINSEQECNIIVHFKYHYASYVNLTKTSVVSTQNYDGAVWLGFYMPGTAYQHEYFVNTCINVDNTVNGEVSRC